MISLVRLEGLGCFLLDIMQQFVNKIDIKYLLMWLVTICIFKFIIITMPLLLLFQIIKCKKLSFQSNSKSKNKYQYSSIYKLSDQTLFTGWSPIYLSIRWSTGLSSWKYTLHLPWVTMVTLKSYPSTNCVKAWSLLFLLCKASMKSRTNVCNRGFLPKSFGRKKRGKKD